MFAYGITAILLCSFTVCNLAPVGSVLDNSDNLWLLKEYEETPPSQQSPPLSSRRITPKSIFIVPEFINPCLQGYQLDSTGQCVRLVIVNEDANKKVFLDKLKTKFSGFGTANRLVEPKESVMSTAKQPASEMVAGPLQLPIPFNASGTNDDDELVGATRNNETLNNNSTTIINSTTIFESVPVTTTSESVPTDFTTGDDNLDATTLPFTAASFAETTNVIDAEFTTVEQNTEPTETSTVYDTISPELIANTETVRISSPQRFRTRSSTTSTTSTTPEPTTTPHLPDEATLFQGDILKTSAVKFPTTLNSSTNTTRTNVLSDEREPLVRNPFASDANLSSKNGGNVVFSSSNDDSKNGGVTFNTNADDRELPTRGVSPSVKCDPANGFDPDCGHESVKIQTPVKKLYPISKPQFTTYIRFPGGYTGRGSSFIRFPAGAGRTPDDIQYDSGSRFWPVDGSNRYSTSYWTNWDPTKPHFVRVWPDAAPVANPYHDSTSRSHSQPIGLSVS